MHNDTVETLIGAAVIAIAVLFVVFVYRTTGSASVGGYEVVAKLSRADGIAVGTDVRLSGLKVGTVAAMTLDDRSYLVVVHMNINADVKIPDDSSLMVTSSGLLGNSYLSISPGGSDKMLPPGGAIKNTQGAIDMMGLLSRFVNGGVGGNESGNNGGATATPKP
jgi:phospholipid/cholesterol/gamma-HCH transport system substrate-binding protein